MQNCTGQQGLFTPKEADRNAGASCVAVCQKGNQATVTDLIVAEGGIPYVQHQHQTNFIDTLWKIRQAIREYHFLYQEVMELFRI